MVWREPVTSYTIRHSFATTLKEQDVPIEMISELLGHNVYQDNADLFEELLVGTYVGGEPGLL